MRTAQASEYLRQEHGEEISVSSLQKMRGRGPDDPRDRGPDFFRDPSGTCQYSKTALDDYAARRRSVRRFRAPASQPENLRRVTTAA
jgi:hypothetical protein